jgi:hypothetical protein
LFPSNNTSSRVRDEEERDMAPTEQFTKEDFIMEETEEEERERRERLNKHTSSSSFSSWDS